jgi:hypothetical protein
MLFNALFTWKTRYIANAFAYSDNFTGRLSWNSSYVLEGLIGLHRVTGHELFALQADHSVAALLNNRNRFTLPGESMLPDFLWATRKYSLDRITPLTLFVNDAKVLYPMLVAANEGLLSQSTTEELIHVAESFLSNIERQYVAFERLYHIKYGIEYSLDGVWAPYNWQSAVGLVLVELYGSTQQEYLRDRASQLAQKFRSEWQVNADGSVMWSYWPREYWAGWDASDGVSTNLPSRPEWTDPYYEDLSHAGLNLKFVIEHRARFGPTQFTDSDVAGIRATVRNFIIEDKFSRFMSGDTEFLPALYRNLPLYGWSQLDAPELSTYYSSFVPGKHPSIMLAMTNGLLTPDKDAALTISSYRYRVNEPAVPVETAVYTLAELPEYFGLQ